MNNTEKKIVEMLKKRAEGWYKEAAGLKNCGFEKAAKSFQATASGIEMAIQYIEEMR